MQELERQFKAYGGTFEEYRIGELFDISTPKKKFNANAIEFGTKYRYVVRTSQNNGIRGYLDEDEKYLDKIRPQYSIKTNLILQVIK